MSVLWRINIFHKTRKLMYRALVQSILLCWAKTWTISKQQANKLLTTYMDIWRIFARKSRKENSEMLLERLLR